MKIKETARRNGNAGWTRPDGPMSRKIFAQAVAIKDTALRIVDHPAVVEELNQYANTLIRESERVANLETARPVVLFCTGHRATIN